MNPTARRTCLVTGANRGLGLEFTRQLVADGAFVVGACRSPRTARDLQALIDHGTGIVVPMDVTDGASISSAAAEVGRSVPTVDLVVNTAGVEDTPASAGPLIALDRDALLTVLAVNIVGPALVTQAFMPLLGHSQKAVVVNLTSRRGLLDPPVLPGNLGYSISKAGLNMLTAKLAAELRSSAITVLAISPGWVQTDMGGPDAPLTPQESVASMLRVIGTLSHADSGAILGHDGTVLASGTGAT
jgi:NAD(P)-dependent dehydrogenase (short-subunit alcohol dehydrogenase family)